MHRTHHEPGRSNDILPCQTSTCVTLPVLMCSDEDNADIDTAEKGIVDAATKEECRHKGVRDVKGSHFVEDGVPSDVNTETGGRITRRAC